MEFEWNPDKADANEQKHKVSFLEASEVFGDMLSSAVLDPDASEGEFRYLLFGQSASGRHLVVSYTERDDRIRLISARDMTAPERKAYEQ